MLYSMLYTEYWHVYLIYSTHYVCDLSRMGHAVGPQRSIHRPVKWLSSPTRIAIAEYGDAQSLEWSVVLHNCHREKQWGTANC